jgi:predicted O-methyltransferase YrrM
MASETFGLSAGLREYIAGRAQHDDAFLTALKEDAVRAEIPPIWISPEQGTLMQIMLRLSGAREVVEVGTLAGYSAIWMARALPADGRLRTIEIEPRHAAFARDQFARCDLSAAIEVLEGDARDVLGTIADGTVDACFIDADKVGYDTYVEHAARILRPDGLLMIDNMLAGGHVLEDEPDHENARAIKAVNEQLAQDNRFLGVIAPLGDGFYVGVRRQS